MPKLPALRANTVINALEKVGFQVIRQKGIHLRIQHEDGLRIQHEDGRVVTIPVHPGKDIGRGLLIKILRDAELTKEEFISLLE
ncbi:MAG TPA: type II toxin-antitoxin system HicA family toxin [Oculatellaceae cyanobacterium]|jgi:predicted RNA binding protein YcfA (HicA-like mRNA interferase family)